MRTMGQVVYKHKKELVTCYFVGFIILFGGTYVIYILEKSKGKEKSKKSGKIWKNLRKFGDFIRRKSIEN